ncbi:hypothetical protein GH714_020889 [Hevea brasiliensis]|uniref:DUF4283 domain-containing protein n=1 Tax=Hevea brasiliensis TaxID=3981 RepID=A0A6A6LLR7_HEVBR|nr:hypothetical protein GH714_020889 [Hevea brasiliensis]
MVYGSYGGLDYSSSQYKEDLKKFRKMALESQEHGSSEYSGVTNNDDNISVEMASLSVNGDTIEGIEFEENEVAAVEEDFSLCLVGRFLTDSPIRFQFMKQTMASLWRPTEGMSAKEIAEGLFLFKFYHAVDRDRVLDMGPWTFNSHLLLIDKVDGYDDPRDVPLLFMRIWVQIHGLKPGFNSDHVVERLGNAMGECLERDENNFTKVKNFSSSWKSYARVRVKLDVRNPLWTDYHLRKKGENGLRRETGSPFWSRNACRTAFTTIHHRCTVAPDDDGTFHGREGGGWWRRNEDGNSSGIGHPMNQDVDSGDNGGVKSGDDGGVKLGDNGEDNKDGDVGQGDLNSNDLIPGEIGQEGITINDTKRRRMSLGKQSNVDLNTSSDPKNGPAVGLQERTRRTQ